MKLVRPDLQQPGDLPVDMENMINLYEPEQVKSILESFPTDVPHVIKNLALYCQYTHDMNCDDISQYIMNCVLIEDQNYIQVANTAASVFYDLPSAKSFTTAPFASDDFFMRILCALRNPVMTDRTILAFYALILKFESKSIDFLQESTIHDFFDYFNAYSESEENHWNEFFFFYDRLAQIPEELVGTPFAFFQKNIEQLLATPDKFSLGVIFVRNAMGFNLDIEIQKLPENLDQRDIIELIRLSAVPSKKVYYEFDELVKYFDINFHSEGKYQTIYNILMLHGDEFSEEQKTTLAEYFINNIDQIAFNDATMLLTAFTLNNIPFVRQSIKYLEYYFHYGLRVLNDSSLLFMRHALININEANTNGNLAYIQRTAELVKENLESFDEFGSLSPDHDVIANMFLTIFNDA